MHILSSILFGLSANLDNLILGTSYELNDERITFFENALIGFIGTLGTFISMLIGKNLASFLPNYLSNLIGSVIIFFLGLYFTIQSIFSKNKNTQNIKNLKGKITFSQTFLLAISLTGNNIGVGIAVSVTGLNITLTCILNFIFSILTLLMGQELADHIIGKLLGKYSSLISGIALIVLGVLEYYI